MGPTGYKRMWESEWETGQVMFRFYPLRAPLRASTCAISVNIHLLNIQIFKCFLSKCCVSLNWFKNMSFAGKNISFTRTKTHGPIIFTREYPSHWCGFARAMMDDDAHDTPTIHTWHANQFMTQRLKDNNDNNSDNNSALTHATNTLLLLQLRSRESRFVNLHALIIADTSPTSNLWQQQQQQHLSQVSGELESIWE